MLNTAIQAAHRAGRIIAERYPMVRNITEKGFRDLVTDTDTAAEARIIEFIKARTPDHGILSEEAGAIHSALAACPLECSASMVYRFPPP